MKQQQTALVLCALLATTFGHELLNHHVELSQSRYQNRDNPLPDGGHSHCHLECTDLIPTIKPIPVITLPGIPGQPRLSAFLNETAGLVALWNSTAQVAIIFDVSASLAVVLNGASGAAVIINTQTESGLYISSGVWSASVSFAIYFSGLSSLQSVWSIGGQRFDFFSRDQVILDVIAGVLIQLNKECKTLLSLSSAQALSHFVDLSKRVSEVFGGNFEIFLSLFVEIRGGISISIGLFDFLGVLEGLFKVVGKIAGGIAALVAAKIKFDLAIITSLASGVAVFAHVITTIVAKLGIAVLGAILAKVEGCFEILVLLGGGVVVGVQAIINIIWQLLLSVQNPGNLVVAIKAIIDFVVDTLKAPGVALASLWRIFLGELIQFLRSLPLPGLSIVVQFLVDLQNGILVIGGINVSGILNIFVNIAGTALDVVVKILLGIAGLFKPLLLIPQLFLVCLEHLTSIRGIIELIDLIPGINIDADAVLAGKFDLIGYIIKNLNPINLITHAFDFLYIILHLPIIGSIFSAISTVVKAISLGAIDLEAIFSGKGGVDILGQIWAFISGLLHLNFKVHVGGKLLDRAAYGHRHRKEPHWVDQSRYLGIHHHEVLPTGESGSHELAYKAHKD